MRDIGELNGELLGYMEAIVQHVNAQGVTCEFKQWQEPNNFRYDDKEPDPPMLWRQSLMIEGINMRDSISFSQQYKSSGNWRSSPTGRWDVCAGNYDVGRKNFPGLKSGGHSYNKIAVKLVEAWEHERDKRQAEDNRQKNRAVVKELGAWEACDGDSFYLSSTVTNDRPVAISFKIEGRHTVEEAKEIIRRLELGKFIKRAAE